VMFILGQMPRTGDIAEWEDWQLEVVDMDGRRIDKILAAKKVV
jgi:putative hemolysin